MHCKDCKYWERSNKDYFDNNYGDCNNEDKFFYGSPYKGEGEFSSDLMFYYDYEGYSAGFYTGQDFGCIHFKPKEPSQ